MEKNNKKEVSLEISLVSLRLSKFKQYYDKKSKPYYLKYELIKLYYLQITNT
jgi:hypothetical protein